MATKKEVTKKKDTATKKKAVPKKNPTIKKEVKPVVEEIIKDIDETTEVKEELKVVNGDPAVLTTVEETKNEESDVTEENETVVKKITKRINRYFGYLWNGQAIDY